MLIMKYSINWLGTYYLFKKEVKRFLAVYLQTVLAPVVNAGLFLVIFYPFGTSIHFGLSNVDYSLFLLPGLLMMSVIQNTFANCSSSILQAKLYGNITFMLVAPLSPIEITFAYISAAVLRGFLVGIAVLIVGFFFIEVTVTYPLFAIIFIFLCGVIMGGIGLIAGIWAKSYDHVAGFQNFIILPLTFLSGVFYSTHNLPPLWHEVSLFNPIFYMINGLRHSLLGQSDIDLNISLSVVFCFSIITSYLAWLTLKTGYRLRS